MYDDLVYATPGLKAEDIPKYFKDGSFGVPAGGAERTYSPRAGRDGRARPRLRRPARLRRDALGRRCSGSATSAPRTGCSSWTSCATRAAASSRASRAASNAGDGRRAVVGRALHRGRPRAPGRATCRSTSAPQGDADRRATPRTTSRASTSTSSRPSSTRRSCRASTPRSGACRSRSSPRTSSPPPSLVGGIFGKGGGKELEFSQLADALEARFGRATGARAFADFRAAEDAEAPVTVLRAALPVPGAAAQVARERRAARPRHAEAQRSRPPPAPSSPASRRAPRTRCSWPARSPRAGTR